MAGKTEALSQNTTWQTTVRELAVFLLLVAIGVCGRWGQPEWCFTPIAAVSVFAGFYFGRLWVAALVPLSCLVLSDLILPAYDHLAVMLMTYLSMIVPVALGRLLRSGQSGTGKVMRWAACGLIPATLFFLTTNFAVWAFKSNYEKTWAGLAECYLAAIPFFRWMLAGDLFYLAVVFGCYALVSLTQRSPEVDKLSNS